MTFCLNNSVMSEILRNLITFLVGVTSAALPGNYKLPIPCKCGCEDEDGRKPNLHQRVSICMVWIIQQLENYDANPCKLNYL